MKIYKRKCVVCVLSDLLLTNKALKESEVKKGLKQWKEKSQEFPSSIFVLVVQYWPNIL